MRLAHYAEQQARGKCTLCDEPRINSAHCKIHRDEHRKAQRERMRRMRRWWRANHDCIYCNGKRKAIEVSPGKYLRWCAVCAEWHSERKRK